MAWATTRPDVTCDAPSPCPITGKTDIFPRREALLGKNFGLIGADGPPTSQTASNQVGELSPINTPPKKSSKSVRTLAQKGVA